jgi:hypothetical protein
MFPFTTTAINAAPLIFTVVTAFGVLVHDTQLDRATTVALALPTALATIAAVDSAINKGGDHVHVEKVSASQFAGLPRLQPREDDRRNYQMRKMFQHGQDNVSIWPSV